MALGLRVGAGVEGWGVQVGIVVGAGIGVGAKDRASGNPGTLIYRVSIRGRVTGRDVTLGYKLELGCTELMSAGLVRISQG